MAKTKEKICEACEDFEVQWKLKDAYSNAEYDVCADCLFLLVNHVLTPKKFKNLLKNGHKANEFMLHGDFYDENGKAIQPAI